MRMANYLQKTQSEWAESRNLCLSPGSEMDVSCGVLPSGAGGDGSVLPF